jgi:hypothetical protein
VAPATAKGGAEDEIWFDGVDETDIERARDGVVSASTKAKRLISGIFSGFVLFVEAKRL